MELGGVPVGVAELTVRCGAAACELAWTTRHRLPAEAGGGETGRRLRLAVDADGAWRGGPLEAAEDGAARAVEGVPGLVPATAAEVILAAAGPGETCLDVFDEASGRRGRACGRRDGARVEAEILGDRFLFRGAPGALPDEVALPAQRARFVRDGAAALPAAPPPVAGTTVAGPAPGPGALRFCGLAADPLQGAVPAAAPPASAPGADCRAKTAAWLARAARAGLEGRTAVGVAWDGASFQWHAWAEVRDGAGWVAVDPSFGQRPARGPRFTVARWAPGDEASRAAAGRRILACWGRGVERTSGP